MKTDREDEKILAVVQNIKSEHPFWGYRRVWAYMKYRQGQRINKKRIYRVMKENNLLVTPHLRLKAKRDNPSNKSKPKPTRPNQFWGTDMTKVMIPGFGWLSMVIVLDWYTKKIVGYSLSTHSRTEDWLDALHAAGNNQFPEGVLAKQQELYLVSDNGSQPTSHKYMQACSVLEIKQIFASYNNPKGNADTERVIRTIKEDFAWIRDFFSPFEFTKSFQKWVDDYNSDYPHSSLNYMTPSLFEKKLLLLTSNFYP